MPCSRQCAVEDVAHPARRRPVAIPGQVGEGHAVVGQHGVDRVGERLDHLAQECGAVGLGGGIEEGDVDELGHPVDGEEHEELALGQAQLADVDVDMADGGLGEALSPRDLLLVPWQAGDAVADQAAMKGAAGEAGDALPQAA